ncbi:hypothetical protein ACFLZV_07120, partial [Candidatus Margulisiibacteriota bacterium]
LIPIYIIGVSPPLSIFLQAQLSDESGPLEGTRKVTVHLYSDNQLQDWVEVYKEVEMINGSCSLTLGEVSSLTADILNIASPNFRLIIEGEEVIIPIHSVPYALRAVSVDTIPQSNEITDILISERVIVGTSNLQGELIVSGSVRIASMLDIAGTVNAKAFMGDGSGLTSVMATGIADDAIESSKIADGSIMDADVSDNAQIAFSKLAISKDDITGIGIPGEDAFLTEGEVEAMIADDGYLVSGNNLSDLISSQSARSNLGLGISDVAEFAGLSLTGGAEIAGIVTASVFAGDGSLLYGLPTGGGKWSDGVGGIIYYSAGNVGIGTTTPTEKVEVAGTLKASFLEGDGTGISNVLATAVIDNLITSGKIADGAIMDADVSGSAAIAFSKLAISKSDIEGLGIESDDTITTNAEYIRQRMISTTAPGAGEVMKWDGSEWIPSPDIDTRLSQAEVGSYAGSEGYIKTVSDTDVENGAQIAFEKLDITKSDMVAIGLPTADTDTDTHLSELEVDSYVGDNGYLVSANNLSEITSASTARTNLGLGGLAVLGEVGSAEITEGSIMDADVSASAAIAFSKLAISKSDIVGLGIPTADTDTDTQLSESQVDSYVGDNGYLVSANNLSEIVSAVTARTNLGLGSLAVLDVVGSAEITDDEIVDADISGSAAIAFSKLAISKSDIVGLGIPTADTDTDTQLSESEVDSYVGDNGYLVSANNLNEITSASTARTNLGLGSLAVLSEVGSAEITEGSIMDADVSASAAIAFSKLAISKSDIVGLGIPTADTDTDTQLSESQVDSYVGDNGYLVSANNLSEIVSAVTARTNLGLGSLAVLDVVGSAEITDDEIVDADISGSAAIAFSKLAISKSDIVGLGIPTADTDTDTQLSS